MNTETTPCKGLQLREVEQVPTKRVRILVAIDSEGKWTSAGYDYGNGNDPHDWIMLDDLGPHMSYHWVEADVPLPVSTTIEGLPHAG